MFKKLFTLTLALVCFAAISAQNIELYAPDTCADTHTAFSIDIRVNGLQNAAGVEFTLGFDPTIMKVLDAAPNGALDGLAQTGIDTNGFITFSWLPPSTGQSLDDSTALMTVDFRILSSVFDGQVSPLDIFDEEVLIYNGSVPEEVPAGVTDGSVTVNCLNFVVPDGKLTLIVDQTDVDCDASQYVVNIVVDSFVSLNGVQFTLQFDQNALDFDSTGNFADLTDLSSSSVGDLSDQGKLTFSWFKFGQGESLADGSTLFSVYFDVIGDAGDDVSISIIEDPTHIEALVGFVEIPVMTMNGMGSIIDTVPPSITCPEDVRVPNPMLFPSIVVDDIAPTSVSDNCETNVTYTLAGATTGSGADDASGNAFNKGVTTVTYVVTDGAGNSDQCSFEVTVADTFKLIALSGEAQCGGEFFAGIAVRNFDDIRGVQFTVTWDSTILEIDSAYSETLPPTVGIGFVAADVLTFSWFDMDDEGRTLDDSTIILTIKFNVVGDLDSSTAFCITGDPTHIEASYDAGALPIIIPVQTCKGEITVVDEEPPTPPNVPSDTTYQCAADVPAGEPLTAVFLCAGGEQTVSPTEVITPGNCPNQFTIVRTWTFTGTGGVQVSYSQTITVDDTTPPVAPAAPADVNVQCASDVPAPVELTATDNCDGDITVSPSAVITPGSCDNQFTQVRTWTFIDGCGNLSSVSQTINVDDTTPPDAPAAPADVNVQCASDVPAPVELTATDNCDGDITVSPSAVITPGSCDNQFTQVRTWTFIDGCGNLSSVSQTINVDDTTPPDAPAAPADVNVQCASDVPAPVELTANDNCDGDITVSPSAVITPGNCDNQFTEVRTWTFTDGCGNSSSVSQTINVDDTTPPDAPAAPADVNVQCASDVPAPVELTANDNCDGDITVSPSAVITPGNCDNQFTEVRTWTFTDGCGNSSSVSQTINVDDTTPPDAPAAPADVNVQCASDVPAPVELTANDNCDGDITVSPSAVITPGNCDNQFTEVRTWTFTDGCGNSSSVSQTINVNDDTPPVLTLPANTTIECMDAGSGGIAPITQITGSIDPNDPTFQRPSGASTPGNCVPTTSSIFNTHYEFFEFSIDQADMFTFTMQNKIGPDMFAVLYETSFDPSQPCMNFLDEDDDDGPGTEPEIMIQLNLAPGAYILVTTTFSNNTTNNNAGPYTYDITSANGAQVYPGFNGPGNTSGGTDTDPSATGEATATDNCSASDDIDITFTDVFTPACGNTGTIERTFVAVDECGNSSSGVQTITIIDETDPTLNTPSDAVVECGTGMTTTTNLIFNGDFEQGDTGFDTDYVLGTGGPFGLLSNPGTYAVSDDPSSVHNNFFPCDDHTSGTGNMMVVNGSDVAGTKVWCQTVTVLPNEPHILTAWATSVELGSPAMLQFSVNGGMVGNVFNLPNVTCSWQQFTTVWNSGAATTAEICIVNQQTSGGGNDFAIDDIAFTAMSSSGPGGTGTDPENTGFATATDNCSDSADILITFTDSFAPGCGNTGTITRTWVAQDECGNTATDDQIIEIVDNLPPTAVCIEDTVFLNEDGVGSIDPNELGAGSMDICSDVLTFSADRTDFNCNDIGADIEVTVTVTDECGNSSTCISEITVLDLIPPTFTICPNDRTFNLDPGLCEIQYEYEVEAIDNCEGIITTNFLGTTFIDNNSQDGNMFDIENVSGNLISIDGIDVHLNAGTTTEIEIYFTTTDDTYVGNENNPGAWTLLGAFPVVGLGNGVPTPVDLGGLSVDISPGESRGLYVTINNAALTMPYTNGANVYNNGELQITAGVGKSYPFGATFSPRTWNGNLFYTIGSCDAVIIEQIDNSGFTSGDFFQRGTVTQTYLATDCNGNTSICEFDITVKEFPNPKENLVCNDLVNVTLSSDDCTALIGADDILEGGPYGCYDDYIVEVATDEDFENIIPGSPLVTSEYIGQTLYVRVIDPETGVPCWGRIFIEDKNIPDLECSSYTVTCDTEVDPILNSARSITRSVTVEPNFVISTAGPSIVELPFVTFPGTVQGVTDVNLSIELSHSIIGEVSATLTSPDGTEIDVFLNAGGAGCNSPLMNVTFDDQAAPGPLPCPAPPTGIIGDFQPAQLFSGFNGETANGTWLLTVTDGVVSDDGMLTSVTLEVSAAVQTGIPLPIPGGGSSGTVRIGTDVFGNPIYRVSNFDPCGDVTISIMETSESFECEDFTETITRMYTVVDESGNSTTCQDTINRLAGTGAAVAFPDDVTISCTNPNTDPSRTGRPNVASGACSDGFTVFDPVDNVSNDGCGTKILREWTVKVNCTGELFVQEQWIAIRDVTAPVIPTCPDTLIKLTDLTSDCNAKIRVSEIFNIIRSTLGAFDQCDPLLDYSFMVDGKVYTLAQGGAFLFFEPGFTDITIFVTNDCGLTSECDTRIFVKDAAPVANCDQETTVGLGASIDYDWDNNPNTDNLANARVCADRIDDGSYDNCGSIVSYEVRRVDGRLGSRFGRYLDCVYFDCEDIGTEVMVELRITNEQGATNTCMASVEVFDKLAPSFHPCPGNQEVACENYDDEDYSFLPFISTTDNGGAFPPVLLVVQTENGAFDTIPTGFYNGFIEENCGVEKIILNRFGQLECDNGTLNIELVAVDFSGNEGRCFFSLKVNPTTFNICDTECRTAPITFGCPTAHTLSDNVEWPCDIEINSCGMGLTPDELEDQAADIGINPLDARPQIFGESCSEVSVGYQDFLLSNIDPNECVVRKIQRTWKITDWCQEDNTTASGAKEWTYQQIIKVLKTSAPTFDACEDVTVTVEDNDDDCAVTGAIEVNASDDCVPSNELEYSYIFDVGNDGSIDFNSELTGGLFPGDDPSTPNIIEGTFPVDVHFIEFTVRDVCGNEEVCGFLVTVEDNKQPSPVCVELFTPVMPSTGSITISARTFDKGSFDNCTANEDLDFFYDNDPFQTERTFTCNDIIPGFPISVDICVRDESGNVDCCETLITIQDPENVCNTLVPTATVSGAIATEYSEPVAQVEVNASSSNGGTPKVMTTGTAGLYTFNLATGYNYAVEPIKDINYRNGVSTFDLVLIAQHVLNVNKFDSPYQIIAADANNDGKITTFDILELRKIVLELIDDLPNNTSWRFVDANYNFPNPANPFVPAFPEVIDFNNLSADELDNDFVAVKIGDVSGDVITKYRANDLVLSAADVAMKAGESYTIDFQANDFTDVFGYQFTLNFDPAVMSLSDVQAGELKGLDASCFGLTKASEGRILTSWNANAVSLQNGTNVFSLTFTALKDAQLSSVLNLTSNGLQSEAYAKSGVSEVSLRFEGAEAQNGVFALYQNEPNPFKSQTVIGFNLPEAANATLTVYDVSGKVLFSAEKQYQQGYNMETITRSELGAASGVLYYKLETADNTATKKMILMN